MTQFGRALLWTILLLTIASSALAQGWAVPASTPETFASCATCPGQQPTALQVGYKAPIAKFTGRILDSTQTSEWFAPVRTFRGWNVNVLNNRLYLRASQGMIASYGIDTLISRLEAHEPSALVTAFSSQALCCGRSQPVEEFLKFDAFVHPEAGKTPGWVLPAAGQDGSERVLHWDVDDQGYVYTAASVFGWGINKDISLGGAGSLQAMTTEKHVEPTAEDSGPSRVVVLKNAGRVYAITGTAGGSTIWDVTNRSNPQKLSSSSRNFNWVAKTTASDYVATVDSSNVVRIFTASAFVTGGAPVLELSDAVYKGLATDGTNFYTLKKDAGLWRIVTLARSGGLYQATVHSNVVVPMGEISNIRYGAGYLVLTGLAIDYAWDLTLFSVNEALAPTPVPLTAHTGVPTDMSYFKAYYSRPPAGFVGPPTAYINILDGVTFKTTSGKTYLFVAAKGLADIYELKNANAVTVTASAPPKVYPGDRVTFVGTPSSSAVTNLVWNFGNPEAGIAKNTTQTSLAGAPMPYQYEGLTPTTLGNKTVTAMSLTDSAVKGSTVVNLQMPTAKFGIIGQGSKYLFTLPNASASAPIVAGDSFIDLSDGTPDSHYVSWNVNGTVTKAVGGAPFNVGSCSSNQQLTFQTFYGPYAGAGATLATTTAPNFIVGLGPTNNGVIGYAVRPFAAAVDLANSTSSDLIFQSASRGSTTGVLAGATISHTWQLVDAQNNVVAGAPVQSGGGFPSSVYSLSKAFVTGTQGRRVRLTLTSTPLAAPCAGLETSTAFSQPLNAPVPAIAGGCTAGGPPCTFTVNSQIAGVDPDVDAWTYLWSVTPTANAHLATSTARSITPILKVANVPYTVSVTATNAISFGSTSTTVTPLIAGSVCGSLANPIAWNPIIEAPSGCTWNGTCTPGETITFTAAPYAYPDANCAPHTFNWNFAPGGPQSAAHSTEPPYGSVPITRTFSNGTVSVTLTVNNGAETGSYGPLNFFVGGGTPPPPPPPPPPTPQPGCGTMTDNTVYINYNGAGCSSSSPGTCRNNEAITFSAFGYGYDFNCANHSFTWSFDGAQKSGASVSHTFTSDGNHNVSLSISRAGTLYSRTQTVASNGGGIVSPPPPPTGCATITPNISLFIQFHNASDSCGGLGAECERGEQLDFTVNDFGAYNIACANHTFEWDFADGTAKSNGRDVKHAFGAVGEFPVKCVVSNGSQTVTLEQKVKIKGDLPAIIPVESDFLAAPIPGIANAFRFDPRFTPLSAVDHWVWNFGDGSAEVTRRGNPITEVHSYEKAGTYTVTLKVYDSYNRELSSPRIYKVGSARRRSARH